MALTKVIDDIATAVDLAAATVIVATGPTVMDAVGLEASESVIVNKLMSDGSYHPLSNKTGAVYLSAYPNVVLIEAAGSYKLTKLATNSTVTCGYEVI